MEPTPTYRVELYQRSGRYPFEEWFDSIDGRAAAQVTNAVDQLLAQNWNNVKVLGDGLFERRLRTGYRIYFGRAGNTLWLLHGGDKNNPREQRRDIARAKGYWQDHRGR